MVTGYRGNPWVTLQKLHQVCGIQNGVDPLAVKRRETSSKLAFQDVLDGAAAILEYVVVNHHIAEIRHGCAGVQTHSVTE